MKRLIVLLTVTAMLLCLAACADKTPTGSDADATTTANGKTTLASDDTVTTDSATSEDASAGTTTSGEEGTVTTDGSDGKPTDSTANDGVSGTTNGGSNGDAGTTTQGQSSQSGSTGTADENDPTTDAPSSSTTDRNSTTANPSQGSGSQSSAGTTTASGNSAGKTTTAGNGSAGKTTTTTAKTTNASTSNMVGPTQSTTTTTTTTQVVIDVNKKFTPTTIMDNGYARVTITAIEEDAADGYTLVARFENRSAEKNCLFMVDTAVVNGVLTDPLYAAEIAAGETLEDYIVFYDVVPEGVDIGEYTDILLHLTVSDADDWTAGTLAQVNAHVYPQGKENATVYRHTAGAGEQVLIDNAYVTAIAVTTEEDARLGRYYSYIYFLNKTNESLMFSVDTASINNIGINPRYGTYLSAETGTFGRVVWLNSTLANSHIQKVDRISFTLTVTKELDWENVDEEDWDSAILVNEKVTLVP